MPQYTTRGTPRLHCSVECRNRANAKKSAPAQRQRQLRRVHAGMWLNPNPVTQEAATEDQIAHWRRRVGEAASRTRRREIKEGRWRNPALDAGAREKLGRPRTLGDNPALHQALKKKRRGTLTKDLTQEERDAVRAYYRERRASRRRDPGCNDRL